MVLDGGRGGFQTRPYYDACNLHAHALPFDDAQGKLHAQGERGYDVFDWLNKAGQEECADFNSLHTPS